MLCGKDGSPRDHIRNPHVAAERDGKAIAYPTTGYMCNMDNKIAHPLFSFSWTRLTVYSTI
jgi:hypothetical protein